jgi:VanZ family protein
MLFLVFSMPTKGITRNINKDMITKSNLDKIAHFLAFAAWAFCWQFAFKNYLNTFFIGIAYGILIEVWQNAMPGRYKRTFSWYDALADALGVIGGLAACYLIQLFL